MPTVTNKALESAYGFKSTGFTVDAQGNITARSLVETQGSETFDLATPANFTITENGSNTAYISRFAEKVQILQCIEANLHN